MDITTKMPDRDAMIKDLLVTLEMVLDKVPMWVVAVNSDLGYVYLYSYAGADDTLTDFVPDGKLLRIDYGQTPALNCYTSEIPEMCVVRFYPDYEVAKEVYSSLVNNIGDPSIDQLKFMQSRGMHVSQDIINSILKKLERNKATDNDHYQYILEIWDKVMSDYDENIKSLREMLEVSNSGSASVVTDSIRNCGNEV